jgi:homoserine O-acetyltransferase
MNQPTASALTRACLSLLCCLTVGCGWRQRKAAVGDLPLQGGGVIRDCVVGYRTFGRLAPDRRNAVLVLTWASGRSSDLFFQIGPGRLVDSSRYFVVVVDALANGVSSSPSNSSQQPGQTFPVFSVADVVESQYRLVTDVLQLAHLHAIVGVSFGGMQALQWAIAHPGLADKVVAIAGSPRSTPADRDRWLGWMNNVKGSPWRRAGGKLVELSPRAAWGELHLDAVDYARQAQAMAALDVTASFGGSLEAAARAVKARMLVVVSPTDDVVAPGPARTFAGLAGAQLLELHGRCGHAAPSCEKATLWPAVDRFLAQ